jgi:hypothetical protein
MMCMLLQENIRHGIFTVPVQQILCVYRNILSQCEVSLEADTSVQCVFYKIRYLKLQQKSGSQSINQLGESVCEVCSVNCQNKFNDNCTLYILLKD